MDLKDMMPTAAAAVPAVPATETETETTVQTSYSSSSSSKIRGGGGGVDMVEDDIEEGRRHRNGHGMEEEEEEDTPLGSGRGRGGQADRHTARSAAVPDVDSNNNSGNRNSNPVTDRGSGGSSNSSSSTKSLTSESNNNNNKKVNVNRNHNRMFGLGLGGAGALRLRRKTVRRTREEIGGSSSSSRNGNRIASFAAAVTGDPQDDQDIEDKQKSSSSSSPQGQKKRRRRFFEGVKWPVVLLLFVLTVVGAVLVYVFTSREEQRHFISIYNVASERLLGQVSTNLVHMFGGTDSLAVGISNFGARFGGAAAGAAAAAAGTGGGAGAGAATNTTTAATATPSNATTPGWPFVTVPDFYLMSKKLMMGQSSIKIVTTTVYHIVEYGQREEWETYTSTNNGWIDSDINVQARDVSYKGPIIRNEERLDFNVIHGNDEYQKENPGSVGTNRTVVPRSEATSGGGGGGSGRYQDSIYLPTWQSAPVVAEYPVYNWDLLTLKDTSFVDALFSSHKAVLSVPYLLPDPDDPDAVSEAELVADWIGTFLDPSEEAMEPYSDMFYPVYKDMSEVTLRPEQRNDDTLVAMVGASFYWRDVLRDVLPDGNTVDVVFENECSPTFTYRVDGSNVEFLGRGDHHSPRYNKYERAAFLLDEQHSGVSRDLYTGIPINLEYCPFFIKVYPAPQIEENHTSNNPIIFTVITGFILAMTSLVFLMYDAKVVSKKHLEHAHEKLRQSSELQLRHFAMMSHEIRTPLNCIVAMASLHEHDSNLSQHQKESIHMIVGSGELLKTVVDDVLDYSKLAAGQLKFIKEPTELQTMLSAILFSMETRALTKQITIRTFYEEQVPPTIQSDGRRLQQILLNLLSNALKFGPERSSVVLGCRVVVDPDVDDLASTDLHSSLRNIYSGKMLQFYVEDYGEGIHPDNMDRIFHPFAQANDETDRVYGGTGLGLSITKKLVENLGGFIQVESEVGRYARFTVNLPLDGDEDQGHDGQATMPIFDDATFYLVCPPESTDTTNKAKRIMDYFDVKSFEIVTSMDSIRHSKTVCSTGTDGGHGRRRRAVLLVQEDLFSLDAYDQLSVSARGKIALVTFGDNHSVSESHAHYQSLEQAVPSSLIMSIQKALDDAAANASFEFPTLEDFTETTGDGLDYSDDREGEGEVIGKVHHEGDQKKETAVVTKTSRRPVYRQTSSGEDSSKDSKRFEEEQRRIFANIRVLVAEDNKVNQKVIHRILQRIGIVDLSIVDNGKKAVEEEASREYDVVLMDLEMPIMGGLEACRRINDIQERKRQQNQRLHPCVHPPAKVFFLTAHVSEEQRCECLDAGGVDFLPKPYNLNDLKVALQKIATTKTTTTTTPSAPESSDESGAGAGAGAGSRSTDPTPRTAVNADTSSSSDDHSITIVPSP